MAHPHQPHSTSHSHQHHGSHDILEEDVEKRAQARTESANTAREQHVQDARSEGLLLLSPPCFYQLYSSRVGGGIGKSKKRFRSFKKRK